VQVLQQTLSHNIKQVSEDTVVLFLQNSFRNALQATRGLAKCGGDGRTIGCKTLISFGSGLTLIIKRQMLSSTLKQ